MPVKIGSFEEWSDAEFEELRRRKARAANPVLTDLLDAVARGTPVRVPLVEGQSARGLRAGISRAATSRGMTVETVEGDGFVAVRKAAEPRAKTRAPGSTAGEPRRRGRPPKHQEMDAVETVSLED